MRTLDRYVLREILPPFLIALLIFTFLLVLPPVMEQLENLLAKGITWRTAVRILWTLVPQALGLTIPMALLVGILIGLGRMSGDRESVALLACGVSPYRLLRPIGLLAVAAALVTAYVMIVAIPDANQTFRTITFTLVTQRVESEIKPRVFFEDFPGWVLYAREDPDPGKTGWKRLIVANSNQNETTIYLAERGRLVVDREQRKVDLVMENGAFYRMGPDGATDTSRFPDPSRPFVQALDANAVFPKINIQPGINEKSIDELRRDAAQKVAAGVSPHPEIIAIQQKFSIPAACLVFSIIGLALGLTVARDGKLAGFVVGILVIFSYYIVMFLAESLTKGHYLNMYLSRWVPNIVLGAFGIVALIWRARHVEGRLPFHLPWFGTLKLPWKKAEKAEAAEPAYAEAAAAKAGSGTGHEVVATGPAATGVIEGARSQRQPSRPAVARRPANRPPVLVIRVPRFRYPAPGLLDRYISLVYVRMAGLSFLALLGLFYISTFLDRSDKIFKGQATLADVGTLLLYSTPRFVYFVIPIAALLSVLVTFGLLSRNSELTVMKACGISLYRVSVPVVLLSLVFSGVIFGMEQEILAQANRRAEFIDSKIRGRTPRVFDALNRQWVVGREGGIYHFAYFDPERRELSKLAIYQPGAEPWALSHAVTADRAVWRPGGWTGHNVKFGDFSRGTPRWTAYADRPLALEPPDYFETEQPVAEMMSVTQLHRYVNDLSESGVNVNHLRVELQRKLAFPFVTLVMTLLAIPFGVSTGRRGALYAVGLGIVLALSYWIVMSLFVALGKSSLLTPMLAAWAPNVIVLGTAAYAFLTVKT